MWVVYNMLLPWFTVPKKPFWNFFFHIANVSSTSIKYNISLLNNIVSYLQSLITLSGTLNYFIQKWNTIFPYSAPCFVFHREDTIASRGKLLYNPKRAPDITKQSYYQKARQRLPVHVRQQFQTWHHLPVYQVPSDAAINKSSMFTQPHKAYGRHFTIHPEWGLHKPIVL